MALCATCLGELAHKARAALEAALALGLAAGPITGQMTRSVLELAGAVEGDPRIEALRAELEQLPIDAAFAGLALGRDDVAARAQAMLGYLGGV